MFKIFEPYNTAFDLESYEEDYIAPLSRSGVVKLRTQGDNFCAVDSEYTEGQLTLDNHTGTGISQYIGFIENRSDSHGKGEVLYRLSKDNGNTYKFYNKSSDQWEEATGSNDWSTASEVDQFLPSFDKGIGRSLKIKIKLVPGENNFGEKVHSPELQNILLFYELDMSIQVDVRRSIKRHFDKNFRPLFKDFVSLAEQTDNIDYSDVNFEIKEPVKVFNITNDSSKTNDIFDRIENGKIYFDSPQPKGSDIELLFHAKLPIYIGPSDEELKDAEIPSVIINIPNMEEAMEYMPWTEMGLVERSESRGFARVRKKGPIPYNFTVNVTVQADFQLQSLPMSDEVNRMFHSAHPDRIPSVVGNRDYHTVHHVDSVESNVQEESRIVQQAQFQLIGFDFGNQSIFDPDELGNEDTDVKLVEEINICLSDVEREFGELVDIN